jgi:SNF2 family DNA or RNA helicase
MTLTEQEVLLAQGDRIDVLKEICEACGEKLIIYAPFRSVLNLLEAELSKHWTCSVVHGGISASQRNQIFANFQTVTHPRILIADPRCMAHGLTLTEASTTVWYAPIDSNEFYTQANGRTTRTGQKYVANIIHLAGSAVERRTYKRLEQRTKVQGVLLDMVAKGEEIL